MNRTGQGNLYYNLSHRLSSDDTTIVKNLASRSLTGRGLGIDVHKHIPTQLCLYWRTNSATGCYTRCLVRTQLECGENDLLLDCLVNGGLVGACECLSRCLPVDEDGPLKPCIFWGRLSAKRHAFQPKFTTYPHLIKSTCNCHCPDIRLSDLDPNTTKTVFCLYGSSQI